MKWVSVDERLPEYGGSYIICTDRNAVCTAHFWPSFGAFSGPAGRRAKYWMPMPLPPTREDDIDRIPEMRIEPLNWYDEQEVHHNCTVHILTNTKTGEVSIGWWRNE